MANRTVLVVDDKPKIFRSLSLNLLDSGYEAVYAKNGAEALALADRLAEIVVVLLDLSLGEENGLDVLEKLLARRPHLPVIMITGYGTFESAVKSIKLGAYDFIPKPLKFDRLLAIIEEAIRQSKPAAMSLADSIHAGSKIVTQATNVLNTFRKAVMLAATDLPVLISGESGCGKELLVELIHSHSSRSSGVLRRINCSAYPEALIDNELFGHEKGAYTGADSSFKGLFEQTDGGTLHLDEIADLPLPSQAKLLRILEDGMVYRLGGSEGMRTDVRVIASTNKDIPSMVEKERFREDLFYRLNAVFLYLPPLREREGDVDLLLDHFILESTGSRGGKQFSPEARAILNAYDWPGNIRELKNVVNMCVAVSPGGIMGAETLPHNLTPKKRDAARETPAKTLVENEREHIIRVLEESKYNKKKASQRLGISRKTLYNRLKGYGID